MGEETLAVSVSEDFLEELAKKKPIWTENIEMEKRWLTMENNCIIRRRKVANLENNCRRLGGAEMLNLGTFCRLGRNKLLKLQCECKMRRRALRRERLQFLQSFKRKHLEKGMHRRRSLEDDDDDAEGDDALRRRRSQLKDFASVSFLLECNDTKLFIQTILKTSRDIKIKELQSKLAVIPLEDVGSIQEIHQKIEEVSTMNLTQVALPIEKQYDWETIRENLNERNISARDYQLLWTFALHPSINKEDWSAIETNKLQQVARSCRFNWDKVARELNTGRTSYQCFKQYARNRFEQKSGYSEKFGDINEVT